MGNINSIVDINGKTMVKYYYNTFCEPVIITLDETDEDYNLSLALSKCNVFLYKGYIYDVETNLVLVSSRYYSTELGRFIQPADVSSLNPQSINGLNLYSYANNNPITTAYSSSSAGFDANVGMVSSLSLGGLASGGNYTAGSKGLSVKFPPQDRVSLSINFIASMAGAFSALKWTMKNPEFYEFWYSAWGLTEHQVLSNLKSPMTKIASVISYGLVAYDTYNDVMGHINAGDSWQTTMASGIVKAGTGAFNVWASAKVGAAIGGAFGGVPGFIIGTIAGVGVGVIINGIFYTEINGKSIGGYIEDGIEGLLEWLF